jgi:protocatechuate 3,4-dioxygenase beta subunit
MNRCFLPLVVVVSLLLCSVVSGQNPGGAGQTIRPGAPTGAQVPGMPPPRDTRALPQTGTARLNGRVRAAQSGNPLRRAQVTLVSIEGQIRRSTTTDGDGRYEFADLPAGRFSISATKAGYVQLQFGQRRPFETGTPVMVADGETVPRIDFTLPRGSVIAVRVTDDFGEPLAGAQVQVQRYQYGQDGQRRLTNATAGLSPFNGTDDRGEIRMYGLMPGDYIVSATVRGTQLATGATASDSSEGFSPTFYPGTINPAEAQPITVIVGEEASAQFSLAVARMARVNGTVVDSEGRPAAGAQLSIVTRTDTSMSSSSAGMVAADGSFSISGVAPGNHSIDVRPQVRPGTTGATEFASMPIAVSGADISNLRIVTGKGASVSGRVVFEGTSDRANPSSPLRVTATQSDPSRQMVFFPTDPQANGMLEDDGSFQLAGSAGRVFFNLNTPPTWMLKSVTLEGDDITDTPLDLSGRQSISGVVIRMTDKLTQVAGQVTDARGQALKDYVVVLLPQEAKEPIVAARWIRTIRPDSNGRFQTRGLRPGRYVATALETIEQGRQFAPEFQVELRRAAREFSVREGESVTVDLKLTTGL